MDPKSFKTLQSQHFALGLGVNGQPIKFFENVSNLINTGNLCRSYIYGERRQYVYLSLPLRRQIEQEFQTPNV